MKSAKLIVIISIVIIFLTSCQIWQNDDVSDISDSSNSQSDNEIHYSMLCLDGIIYLRPDSVVSIKWADENGAQMFYQLSVMKDKWLPVDYSIVKIGSVTDKRYYETSESTIDIYKVKIGNWIGYCGWDANLNFGDAKYEILNAYISDSRCSVKAKDCHLLKIFDDIYRINPDDSIVMATSRITGEYNYETIEKQSLGDHSAWEWTYGVYCDPGGSDVFYLTSRDGDFYSLWKLDLLAGKEERYTHDTVVNVVGLVDNWIITYLQQKDNDDPFGKMIYITNPSNYMEIDSKYNIFGEVLAPFDGGEDKPRFIYNTYNILINNIAERLELYVMIHGTDTLVITASNPEILAYPTTFYFLDLGDMTCGTFYIDNMRDITLIDYARMLEEANATKVPVEDAEIDIVITQDMRSSGS